MRISSTSFSTRTFAREEMALWILENCGAGRPLHRLERVHEAFLTKEDPGWAESRMVAMGSTAPSLSTRSLTLWLSPAMFPIPQIACSTTSMCGELNNWIRALMVPFSISTWTWSWLPDARLVKHHAASNYRIFCKYIIKNVEKEYSWIEFASSACLLTWIFGKFDLCNRERSLGTRLESITCWIGGFFSYESNLLKPIVANTTFISFASNIKVNSF